MQPPAGGTGRGREPARPAGEARWLTASPTRRWTTVESRLADTSWEIAVEIAPAGILNVDCTVAGLHVGPPVAVTLTPDWAALCRDERAVRAQQVTGPRDRALALAPEIETVDSALAAALAAARPREDTAGARRGLTVGSPERGVVLRVRR